MQNIKAKVNDQGKLVLFIDLKAKGEDTQTGKSVKVAWTTRFEKLDVEGVPDGMSLMLMLTKKKGTIKKAKKEEIDEDDDDMEEKPTRNKGKKPNLNKDKTGKVKAIASSKRPADKLKTRRAK